MGTRLRLNSLVGIALGAVLAIGVTVASPAGEAWADAEDDAMAHHSRAVVFGLDAETETARNDALEGRRNGFLSISVGIYP